MKKVFLVMLSYSTIVYSLSGVISHTIPPHAKETRQLIVHFAIDPRDADEHQRWNHVLHEAKNQLNTFLQDKGYLKPHCDYTKKTFFNTAWNSIKELYYWAIYRKSSSKYPHKLNEVFFTRVDHDFGNFTLYIPDGISERIVIDRLKRILDEQGVTFHIDRDVPVQIAQEPSIGLEGVALTLEELEAVKRSRKNSAILRNKDQVILDTLDQKTKKLSSIKEQLFWHHCIPTTGLRLEEPFYPPSYPFMPHMFSLWQLAPKKGRGVKVAVIDTGVACVEFTGAPQYKKNIDLTLAPDMVYENLNIVSHNGLDPIEQLVNLVYPHIDPHLFNETEVSQEVIEWVHDYLQNQNTDKMIAYFKKKGKKELFEKTGQLTAEGKQTIHDITSGPYGIVPSQGEAPLQFVHMQKPYAKKVIKQLLPIAPVSDENVTYIAGHGSHTYGLAAGLYQGDTNLPEDDIGICGLAPEASAFMIKAFKNDGTSDKSTLIAGLKKAILFNADVVSLSLKIADNMDLTASLSKLLEKMVDLIPYVVAASGNGGDSHLHNYVGTVEAYPARYDAVEFDVGSFGFKDMQCPINDFSQYEKHIGPKFVAPGFNILSSALVPAQKEDSMYVFMDGTSMATPLMAGFVALMLSEFQHDFTRDELLKVCYTAVMHMHNTGAWKEKVLLGVLDMRTALFVLHVMRQARSQEPLKKLSFDKLLAATYELIFDQPQVYGKMALGGADFRGNFMTYLAEANIKKQALQKHTYFKPNNLNDAIKHVVENLSAAYQLNKTKSATDLEKRVSAMLTAHQDPDIYAQFPQDVREHIITSDKKEDYWQKQAQKIRNDLETRKKSKGKQ